MPENDFEKNVQQLFDGFKLKPSDEVWAHVNDRLQKNKRRRRFIFWAPAMFMVMLLGAGAYRVITQGHASASRTTTYHEIVSEQEKKGGNNTVFNKAQTAETLKENRQPEAPVAQNEALPQDDITINKANNETDHLNISATRDTQPVNAQAPDKNDISTYDLKSAVETSKLQHKPVAEKNSFSASKEGITPKGNENKMVPANNDVPGDLAISRVTGYLQKVEYPLSFADSVNGERNMSNVSLTSQIPVKLSKKKRWEWGIEAGTGVSKIGKSIADFLKTASDIDKPAFNSLPSNMTNSGTTISNITGQNNIYIAALAPAPSSVKAGLGWRAGFFVRLQARQRLSLSSGLMYNYFSTQREVGKIISPSQSFNQNGNGVNARYSANYTQQDGKNYTNKYHYITLPVGIEWQLNKGIKLPVALNAGVGISWLTATDALHYNANTGSYFEDKNRFNRLQAGIYTGLSVKLFQHGRHSLDIGPVIQYNLNDLVKSHVYKSQNMMYGGISARLALWKQ